MKNQALKTDAGPFDDMINDFVASTIADERRARRAMKRDAGGSGGTLTTADAVAMRQAIEIAMAHDLDEADTQDFIWVYMERSRRARSFLKFVWHGIGWAVVLGGALILRWLGVL